MFVRATAIGFHRGIRIYPDEKFDYPDKLMKKNKHGKSVLPNWVEDAAKPSSVLEQQNPSKPVSVKEAGKSVI